MEEEKIIENIKKSISSRLKVPIILTYVCVLFLYNWDILFYLFFENDAASNKIECIKSTYGDIYYSRILICLLIAIVLVAIFTVINTLLNSALKWFYRKDKEITSDIENFEKINLLTEQLSQTVDEIKRLNLQVENLQKVNQSLSTKNLEIDTSEISKVDFNSFVDFLNSKGNNHKLLYSFKELLKLTKNNPKIDTAEIFKSATYEEDMEQVLSLLQERNLVKPDEEYRGNKYVTFLQLSKSFKVFLKMEF